ncbi:MAG: response regulator [Myxococcales bacterium]|nr:response regulator [Myxococcales bacterium]
MSARVLIVDDNIDLAENVAELFEEVGAGVTICNTARQALERTKAAPFDLAVVDVRLPDMTSVELVPRLRALAPHGEVLLMTGNASLDTAIEAVRQGVYAYVQKPFAPDDMLALGERALAQVELRRERARLADELGRSERLHRGVVETVESLIIGLDRSGAIAMWNRCATEVTGWEQGDVLGAELRTLLVAPSARDRYEEALSAAWTGERVPDFEAPIRTRAGLERTVRWNLKPLLTPDEEAEVAARSAGRSLEMMLVVGDDVTERLDLEKRAADAEAMASLATLTAGLAHEIRNPLNAAILQLELLGRLAGRLPESGVRDRIGNSIKLVQGEIRRLSLLLEEFLGLARPKSIDLYPLDVSRLVGDVVAMQRPVAEAAGVTIETRVPPGLALVMGDQAKLTQVLVNLVVNAIDALRGRAGARIEIDAEMVDGQHVAINLHDNGPGIAEVIARDVFRPFVSTKETGTGLGLTIVKKIVDLHGGEVELLARDEGGTNARVTLRAERTLVDGAS